MTGNIAASRVSNFCQGKAKKRGAREPSPPYKAHKGAEYGIPDSSCSSLNDGALRADHRRLPETAGMVTGFRFIKRFDLAGRLPHDSAIVILLARRL